MIFIGITHYDGHKGTINLLQVAALQDTSHGRFVMTAGGEHIRVKDESYDLLIEQMGNLNAAISNDLFGNLSTIAGYGKLGE